jgi:ATP-dependent protease ClpP protease subunit
MTDGVTLGLAGPVCGGATTRRSVRPTSHRRPRADTGRPVEEIADDARRGLFLDAREAVEYGLIDAIRTTAR